MYIAAERLHVAPGVYREVGEAVPEADTWSWQTRDSYLRNHRLREIASPPQPKEARHAEPTHR